MSGAFGRGIAFMIEQLKGGTLVLQPGWRFRLMTIITLTTGSSLLMWLGEQATERGIGVRRAGLVYVGALRLVISMIADVAHAQLSPGQDFALDRSDSLGTVQAPKMQRRAVGLGTDDRSLQLELGARHRRLPQ